MISYHFINPFKYVSIWHYCDRLMPFSGTLYSNAFFAPWGNQMGIWVEWKYTIYYFVAPKYRTIQKQLQTNFLSYTTNAHISLLSKDFHYPKNVKFRITRKLSILPKDRMSCYEMKQNLKKQQQWRHGRTWRVMIKTLNMNVVLLWDVVSVAADSNKWRHVSEICSTG